MIRSWRACSAVLACAASLAGALGVPLAAHAAQVPGGDWPAYGRDAGGMRFSPLTQITPANVAQLKPAWVFHMAPPGPPLARGGAFGGAPPGEGGGGRGQRVAAAPDAAPPPPGLAAGG